MNNQQGSQTSCILALDFGLRRIGVATANSLTNTANALTTITARDGQPDWALMDQLIEEWQPDILVLGLPYNIDNSESEMTARIREFQQQLADRYAISIATTDERYTSAEAETLMKAARIKGTKTKRVTKGEIDALAAQLIAEQWLHKKSNNTN